MPPSIEQAQIHDAPAIMELITLCMQGMRASGIDQWDDIYPNLAVVEEDALAQSLFVILEDGLPVATICLNEVQPEEYRPLAWQIVTGKSLVIHRLCVHPSWRGHGFARQLMQFAETLAAEHGFASIRLDSYTGNPRAQALYEGRGYHRVGQVWFPRRSQPFDCFEKRIG
jgi:GNAT superfamily N-acetyltransferase